MKLYHYVLLYVALGIIVITVLDLRSKQYKAVIQEKQVIDHAFDTAIDSAAFALLQADNSRELVFNKDGAMDEFLVSLYSSLGYLTAKDKQEEIQLYLPIILVTQEDGYYVNYSDTYIGEDEYLYFTKRWSEKLTYYSSDEDFIYSFTLGDRITLFDKNQLLDQTGVVKIFELHYKELKELSKYDRFRQLRPNHFLLQEELFYQVKRNTINDALENSMSYYLNEHNRLASSFGVSYQFLLPSIDNSDFARAIEKPGMIVIFQGYPFGNGLERYNRISVAGAKLSKNQVFYLEQRSWYFLYHRSECVSLKDTTRIIDKDAPYYFEEELIQKGAYSCEACSGTLGAHVIDYLK